MNKIYFTVFEPDKKFRFTPNWIMIIAYVLLIAFGWSIEGAPSDSILNTCKVLFIVATVFLSLYFIIGSFWMYEHLEGKLNGKIEFEANRITLNDKTYELEDITNLKFRFNNFHGERLVRLYKSFNGLLSQGVIITSSLQIRTMKYMKSTLDWMQKMNTFY